MNMGHLVCIQYAHEHGCHWDEDNLFAYAAKNGHLNCLQYAHDHGCPWNEYTCEIAAVHGNLNCLQYAHEHGCPYRTTFESITSVLTILVRRFTSCILHTLSRR